MWLSKDDRLTLAELQDLKKVLKELKLDRTLVTRELELSKEIVALKTQISDLEIQRAKLKEDHAKDDRELRHMIGLEKKRQEFEIAAAKKETTLIVREENLAADTKRFEDHLTFIQGRFLDETKYLKEILVDILARLPNITVERKEKK